MPPPARRIPSYFRACRFSSLTDSHRLSATLIISRAFSRRRARRRDRWKIRAISHLPRMYRPGSLLRGNPSPYFRSVVIRSSTAIRVYIYLRNFFFFSFLLHPKNYYNLSLQVTFSNRFDNLYKSLRAYAQWHINYSL